jgi:hypothetical protein
MKRNRANGSGMLEYTAANATLPRSKYMTLAEIIPSIRSLSQEDKIRLINFVTTELTAEMGLLPPDERVSLNPGYGLHDSHEAAAILAQFLADERSKNV